MNPRKVNVINVLQLLGSRDLQGSYYHSVPEINVVVELVNQWFDDSFLKEFGWFREIFTEEEWKILSEFDNFFESKVDDLPNNYMELRDSYSWKQVVGKANWALDRLGWQGLMVTYD